MKSIEQFGKPLVDYQGVAHADYVEHDSKISSRGYFQAAQFPSGRLAITYVPTDLPRPTKLPIPAGPGGEVSFEGADMNGWQVTHSGQTFFSKT